MKKLIQAIRPKQVSPKLVLSPTIIPRAEHNVSRRDIDSHALKVLYRLHEAGFHAYLVGGCVRDLLLGQRPKDFDIATNAHPEEVRRLFKNCRLIGKRFRLAHILFGNHIIEVATFRTHHQNALEQHAKMRDGMIVRDNVYGLIEDDVLRRDYGINALYYNIADFSIVDFVGGMNDIKQKVLRMIGNPLERFTEDPVRLLRAIRFLAKLDITIDPDTEKHLIASARLLEQVSNARLFQEILKMFESGTLLKTLKLLQQYNLLSSVFLHSPQHLSLVYIAAQNSDDRVRIQKTVSPAFLLAAFLWPLLATKTAELEGVLPRSLAFDTAANDILKEQTQKLALSRLIQTAIREIASLQFRFHLRRGNAPLKLLDHPRFRAAYDLLLLRAESGEPIAELAGWWKQFHDATTEEQLQLLKDVKPSGPFKKRSKFRKRTQNR